MDTNIPPLPWQLDLHGVTQGLLSTWAMCPQKAAVKAKEGLRPTGGATGALGFGDIVHQGLDQIYTQHSISPLQKDAMVARVDEVMADITKKEREKAYKGVTDLSTLSDLEHNLGVAKALLKAYLVEYYLDLQDITWIDLERTFAVPYIFKYEDTEYEVPFRGKIDGVFRTKDGSLFLFETKTKGTIDDTTISDRLPFELQTMAYLWAMKHIYNETPRGVLYNVVRRPALRLKQNETGSQFLDRIAYDIESKRNSYFARFYVTIRPSELELWETRDFIPMMDSFCRWAIGDGPNYRNSGACIQYNRPCEFLRYCAYGDKSRLITKEEMFPELLDISTSAVAEITEGE